MFFFSRAIESYLEKNNLWYKVNKSMFFEHYNIKYRRYHYFLFIRKYIYIYICLNVV